MERGFSKTGVSHINNKGKKKGEKGSQKVFEIKDLKQRKQQPRKVHLKRGS